ncbi:MAG: tetratricopeptide repeat protein, partial [Bacteroidales bacterium]|nr:tetratricopeptide repeat protein [Bacteroidales bacterium]
MRKHIFALVFFASCVAMAQDSLFVKAQQYMNASRWIEAQNILKQGLREGGDTMLYSYELAWAYYSNKEYAQAIKTLAPFLNKDDSPSEIYQLLGNAYDENGNSYKAVDIYKQGLAKYPKAGNLFLEIGNIEFKKGNFKDALYWYEKGIENDPLFASNYYRAAKVFFMSTEMVWGIMYGEIFMLLSDDNERKQQMSKDLCEAYFSCIKEIDGKPKADFNNNIIVYSDSYERKNLFPQVYNNTMQNCLKSVKSLNIANLINIRKSFIN